MKPNTMTTDEKTFGTFSMRNPEIMAKLGPFCEANPNVLTHPTWIPLLDAFTGEIDRLQRAKARSVNADTGDK